MRKKMAAANWKMNKTFSEAEDLLTEIVDLLEKTKIEKSEMIICPPFPYLEMALDFVSETDICLGAQNVSEYEKGAYTGEVSAEMLASMTLEYCIVGHSERRSYFRESNQQIAKKIEQLLKQSVSPIFCCGEPLEVRNEGKHFDLVKKQIEESLFFLNPADFSKIVIAYEPVWAIGTGVTATSEQAQEMHAFIRSLITGKYGAEIADDTTILYGGSCNAKNAKELFANPDVDGGLIGGASLVAADFVQIANSF